MSISTGKSAVSVSRRNAFPPYIAIKLYKTSATKYNKKNQIKVHTVQNINNITNP